MAKNDQARRVFLGIPISEDMAQHCHHLILFNYPVIPSEGRWMETGKHHITLRFIAPISDRQIESLIQSVHAAIQTMPCFEVFVDTLSIFTARHQACFIGANIQRSAALQTLHDVIETCARHCNIQPNHRSYRPHMTLCRFKKNQNVIMPDIRVEEMVIPVNKIILYESIMADNASYYKNLHSFDLAEE